MLCCIMSNNHKVISNLTKSTDQHKFHENRIGTNLRILKYMMTYYILSMQDYRDW